jgi:hypothetical protein
MSESPVFKALFSVFLILWIGSFLIYRAARTVMRRVRQVCRFTRSQGHALELPIR